MLKMIDDPAPGAPDSRTTVRQVEERIEQRIEQRVRAMTLGPREWPGVFRQVMRRSSADRITTAAGSLSFHWFLALFPAAIALLGLAGLVGLTHQQLQGLVHGIGVIAPSSAANVLVSALRTPLSHRASATAVIAGGVVALWSAVESMAALQVGLDIAYESGSDRGFVRRRIVALPLLGATVVLGGSAFALLVVGQPIGTLLRHSVPVAGPVFAWGWTAVRWVGAVVLVSLLLSAIYSIGPMRDRRRWEWMSPGGVLAVAAWLGASAAYSVYLDNFGHASRTYGAFAGVAVLLLWLFISGLAVLLGAELNRELERMSASSDGDTGSIMTPAVS